MTTPSRSLAYGLAGFLLMQVLFVAKSSAEKRVALVIGNAHYQLAGTLKNPKNDAADIARSLKHHRFKVVEGYDLDKSKMDAYLRDFAQQLVGSEVALFFFAGHGLQVSGVNYVVPTDARLDTVGALDFETIRLDVIQRLMEKESLVKLLFVDACRNNPLARSLERALGSRSVEVGRGLASMESGLNTLISFSTQPGNVALDGPGRNSPFSGPLAKEMRSSNLDLIGLLTSVRREVVDATNRKQIPWEHHALLAPFYFSGQPISRPDAGTANLKSRSSNPLSELEERLVKPGDVFRECTECPQMIVVPAGTFKMGSPETEAERNGEVYYVPLREEPQHQVAITKPFAVGRFQITRKEFKSFVEAASYRIEDVCSIWRNEQWEQTSGRSFRDPGFQQEDDHPVVCVSWNDAQAYVKWLSQKSGKTYRLLTEAQWEYAARAGTITPFWWGTSINVSQANYDGRTTYGGGNEGQSPRKTMPVTAFDPNPWGIQQVLGNAWNWVEDCFNEDYVGAPSDGSAWTTGNCRWRMVRGGGWMSDAWELRSARRSRELQNLRAAEIGFRVVRQLSN